MRLCCLDPSFPTAHASNSRDHKVYTRHVYLGGLTRGKFSSAVTNETTTTNTIYLKNQRQAGIRTEWEQRLSVRSHQSRASRFKVHCCSKWEITCCITSIHHDAASAPRMDGCGAAGTPVHIKFQVVWLRCVVVAGNGTYDTIRGIPHTRPPLAQTGGQNKEQPSSVVPGNNNRSSTRWLCGEGGPAGLLPRLSRENGGMRFRSGVRCRAVRPLVYGGGE